MVCSHRAHRLVSTLALAAFIALSAGCVAAAAELKVSTEAGFFFQRFACRRSGSNQLEMLTVFLCLRPEENFGSSTEGRGYRLEDPGYFLSDLNRSLLCHFDAEGVVTLGPFSLRVNGVDLSAPPFKVSVLPALDPGSGLTVAAVDDPNGSGQVMLLVDDHRPLPERLYNKDVALKRRPCPRG